MKLIRNQFLDRKKIDKLLTASVLVLVIGNEQKNALSSLKKQVYYNFRVISINKSSYYNTVSGEIKLSDMENTAIQEQIADIIESAEEDYIYFMDGADMLFPHSLLEYVSFLENQECDVVYADECSGNVSKEEIYNYELKPEFEYIAAFQSMYTGRAVIFKREKLHRVIGKAVNTELDTLLRELFLLCVEDEGKIGQIPLVLLLKANGYRNAEAEKKLIPLIQKNVAKYTAWTGKVSRTNSYNQFAFEMLDIEKPCSFEFIVVEENLLRTRQLLAQIGISYGDCRIIAAVQEEHLEEITDWCDSIGLKNISVVKRDVQYTATLEKLRTRVTGDVQILLSDQVQWLNRMNVERLILTFHKPEVKAACPQIATEGEHPTLIYAGGEINSLALTSNYLKGRSQGAIFGFDPAWTNHKVTKLTPYCLAMRRELWDEVFPLHESITEAWQFALEVSLLCSKKGITCEYVAQSAFWVNEDIGKWYVKENENEKSEIEIEQDLNKIRCGGSYWHWLSEYSNVIEEAAGKMRYAQRSYRRYLQESFKVFGLEHVKETGHKRVLVFSHELSLTGAPLILVQAVECLKKMNYDVIVVSPVDGPLRETYLKSNVPVMIEPELFSDFEYIKIVYDFDFVIACTVCLWQVIEVLGKTDIPVLWWVHDSRMGYVNWLRYVLPETIGDNIHLYCGGDYAQKVILEYRPKYSSQILLYGLEDFSDKIGNTLKREHWNIPSDKIAFANIGQIISRKGQDVLVAAIEKLPDELLRQSVFIFVGGVVDRKIYNNIMELQKRYPDNIRYIEQISHEDLKQFYREIDCIVCSSVDDPLPAFVAEGLMMSRLVICSKNTAFNGLIEDGKNGYLFESGNVEMLYDKIVLTIRHKEQLERMKNEARKLYESTFTSAIFQENFSRVIEEVIE